MLLHHAWLSSLLFTLAACEKAPLIFGRSVYYNSTGLSPTLPGTTHAPSGSGVGTVYPRGLTETSANLTSTFYSTHIKLTGTVATGQTGISSYPTRSVKPSYSLLSSGTHVVSTGKPNSVTSTVKQTAASTGLSLTNRSIPSSVSAPASTGTANSIVKPTRLSTGYTYSRSSYSPPGSGYTSSITSTFNTTSSRTSTATSLSHFSSNTTITPTTASASQSALPTSFVLQIFVTANTQTSPQIDGSYISIYRGNQNGTDALLIVPNQSSASSFTLSSDGSLTYGDEVAFVPASGEGGEVVMQAMNAVGVGLERVKCENLGGVLSCDSGDGGDMGFETCKGEGQGGLFVEVGDGEGEGCVGSLLLVVWGR